MTLYSAIYIYIYFQEFLGRLFLNSKILCVQHDNNTFVTRLLIKYYVFEFGCVRTHPFAYECKRFFVRLITPPIVFDELLHCFQFFVNLPIAKQCTAFRVAGRLDQLFLIRRHRTAGRRTSSGTFFFIVVIVNLVIYRSLSR